MMNEDAADFDSRDEYDDQGIHWSKESSSDESEERQLEHDSSDSETEDDEILWEHDVLCRCDRFDFDMACRSVAENDPEFTLFEEFFTFMDDSDADLLGKALDGNTNLEELDVKLGSRLTFGGASALAEKIVTSNIKSLSVTKVNMLPLEVASQLYISPMQKVTTLMLHLPLDDYHAIKLGEALRVNRSLEELLFQVPEMTPTGAEALANGIVCSRITQLHIHSKRGSETSPATKQPLYMKTSPEIMRILYTKGCGNIENLSVCAPLGDINALSTVLTGLHTFHIGDVLLTYAEVQILSEALLKSVRLTSLSITACELNDEHVRLLSNVIGCHQSIETLRLRNNSIGDDGIASLVESWGIDSPIRVLNLDSNQIGDAGAHILLRALADLTMIRELDLDDNPIGYEGLKLIGDELGGNRLQELHLNCFVPAQTKDHAAASKALLGGVRGNAHLTRLELGPHVQLVPRVREELELYLEANKNGRSFMLREQFTLPPGIWCYFLSRQSENTSLLFLFLLESPSLLTIGRPTRDDRFPMFQRENDLT